MPFRCFSNFRGSFGEVSREHQVVVVHPHEGLKREDYMEMVRFNFIIFLGVSDEAINKITKAENGANCFEIYTPPYHIHLFQSTNTLQQYTTLIVSAKPNTILDAFRKARYPFFGTTAARRCRWIQWSIK